MNGIIRKSMKFKLQTLFTSTFGVGNALFLSRIIPRWLGYTVANFIADRITSFHKALPVQAVRANQWVVSGEKLSATELDALVRQVYRYKARALYDYYHDLGKSDKVLNRVRFSPMMEAHLERMHKTEQGTMMVIPHVGNFDEAGQALAAKGLQFQILSYPHPSAGYRWENRIPKAGRDGSDSLCLLQSMRQAKHRLQQGWWYRFDRHGSPAGRNQLLAPDSWPSSPCSSGIYPHGTPNPGAGDRDRCFHPTRQHAVGRRFGSESR